MSELNLWKRKRAFKVEENSSLLGDQPAQRGETSLHIGVRLYAPQRVFFFVFVVFFFFFRVFFGLLGLHPWHMEVPMLGVELDLQLLACTTATATPDPSCNWDLHHRSWQHQILNPLSRARDQAHILMDSSQVRYHWATMELHTAHKQFSIHYFILIFPTILGAETIISQMRKLRLSVLC